MLIIKPRLIERDGWLWFCKINGARGFHRVISLFYIFSWLHYFNGVMEPVRSKTILSSREITEISSPVTKHNGATMEPGANGATHSKSFISGISLKMNTCLFLSPLDLLVSFF